MVNDKYSVLLEELVYSFEQQPAFYEFEHKSLWLDYGSHSVIFEDGFNPQFAVMALYLMRSSMENGPLYVSNISVRELESYFRATNTRPWDMDISVKTQFPAYLEQFKRDWWTNSWKTKVTKIRLAGLEARQMAEAGMEQIINPMLALDQGSAEIIDYEDGLIIIKYHGQCTNCGSAEGETLDFINNVYMELYDTFDISVMTINESL